ncbi:MAG: beta-lactamase family protein [Chloroflexota bacterium]|nr:beta-lactamase family protein [Chloroflexota bacterium]
MTLSATLTEIDAIFDRFHATTAAPGCAFGVVIDGAIVHAGGRGTLRDGEAAPPDADSVFRIASMTKSFTAATILSLRDEGVLGLDDGVATWVPELAAQRPWSSDSPPITIRALLTMSAGLPTDDPWGDRQQDLDPDAFLRFLANGIELAWPPDSQFEYANLGYAILGVVITRAAGVPYRTAVEGRILAPLGLAATAFEPATTDPGRLALGYHRRADEWVAQPMAGHGAFASMGGLFSTVRDLATWAGWLAAAFPARDDPDPARPLTRATRREMQQVQRAIAPELRWTSAATPPVADVWGYGFGLFVNLDVKRGRTIGHGGGYPGYGSHMRWHPATGMAVVGVANGRYAPMATPCREALSVLVDGEAAPVHRPRPWPALAAARSAVEALIDIWDDAVANSVFAMNVDLDDDRASRRAAIETLRDVHGRLHADPTEPAVSLSAADLTWWLAGDRGRVKVELLLSPEHPPRIQWLELTSVPDAPPALTAIAERVVGLLAGRFGGEATPASPAWPADIPLADSVDRAALERDLRATEAIFGPLTLGPMTAGDGERAAAWQLAGRAGDVMLSLELDPAGGTIQAVALIPVTHESPVHLA